MKLKLKLKLKVENCIFKNCQNVCHIEAFDTICCTFRIGVKLCLFLLEKFDYKTIMLGQLLHLLKTVVRRLHTKRQTQNSWIYYNGYVETRKMDIENCESCEERRSKVTDHSELNHVKEELWTIPKWCNLEYLKLLFSCVTLLINFIVVTLMICDLKLLESKMYSKSEMQKYQHNTKSDFCIHFPKGTNKGRELNSWTFHCLKNSQYLRHLFDMVSIYLRKRKYSHEFFYEIILRFFTNQCFSFLQYTFKGGW